MATATPTPKAALPAAVTQMKDPIADIMAGAQKQTATLQAEQQQKEAAIKQQQAAAEAPLQQQREAAVQDFQHGLANGPEQVPMPENKAEHIDPKEMSQAAGLMMGLAALAGSMTRAPLTASLKAMTGAMQGLQAGDEQQFQRDYDTYKTEFDKAIGINKARVAEYDKILKGKEFNIREMDYKIKEVAKKYGDELVASQTSYKDMQDIIRGQEKQEVALSKWHAERHDKKLERDQQHADKAAALAETRRFHDATMSMQRERLTMAKEHALAKAGGPGGKPSTGGEVSKRMAASQFGAIQQLSQGLENVLTLDLGSSMGSFSDYASSDKTTLMKALGKAASNQIQPTSFRLFEQHATGLETDVGRIISPVGAGAAARVTEEMHKARPRETDSPLVMANWLAMLKQQARLGTEELRKFPGATEEQIAAADAQVAYLNEVVPWSVQDVHEAAKTPGKKSVREGMLGLLKKDATDPVGPRPAAAAGGPPAAPAKTTKHPDDIEAILKRNGMSK